MPSIGAARVRIEQAQVLRDADARGVPVAVGVGAIALAQRARHQPVRAHHRRQHQRRPPRIARARRPLPRQVALGDQDVRLVDRAPPVDEIAERRARAPGERGQRGGRAVPVPAAAGGDPGGQREVVERHDRRDARGAQPREHLAVAGGGRLVPHARRRLEPAPLDAQAVGVGADQLQRRQIGSPQVPRIGDARRAGAARDVRRSVGVAALLPVRPVVVRAAFDLVRGRRGAQEEAVRRARQRRRGGDVGGGERDRPPAARRRSGRARQATATADAAAPLAPRKTIVTCRVGAHSRANPSRVFSRSPSAGSSDRINRRDRLRPMTTS